MASVTGSREPFGDVTTLTAFMGKTDSSLVNLRLAWDVELCFD
jgi:hypothetical protein